jgi:hypothetical protein
MHLVITIIRQIRTAFQQRLPKTYTDRIFQTFKTNSKTNECGITIKVIFTTTWGIDSIFFDSCALFSPYICRFHLFNFFSGYDSPDHRAGRGPQEVAGSNGDSGTHAPRTHAWNNGLADCASKGLCLGLKCNYPKDTASLLR